MTKWHDNRYFEGDKSDIIIASEETINPNYNTEKTFSCEFCKRSLTKLIDSSGENVSFYCSNCSITTYNTDNLRSETHLEMSGPPDEPAISYAPEPQLKRKKKEIKGGLAEIAKRTSVNILSYEEGKG